MFRSAATTLPRTLRQTLRQMGGVALACSVLVIGGCGGGDRAEPYRPYALVAFGDENSAMENFSSVMDPVANQARTITGLTYTMNNLLYPSLNFRWYCTDTLSETAEPCAEGSSRPTDVTEFKSTVNPPASPGDATSYVSTTFPNDFPWYHFASVNTGTVSNTITWTDKGNAKINGATTTTPVKMLLHRTYACSNKSIWIQYIAFNLGLAFGDQCSLATNSRAYSAAAYGAKVADVATQVQANQSRLGEGVLVTLMVGQHDVLEAFNALLLTADRDAAMVTAKSLLDSRAAALASQVRSIIQTKAKVVLALVPDFSESPYPAAASLSEADRLRLKELIKRFNDKVYITGLSDVSGRSLVSVNPDPYTNPALRGTSYNYTQTACVFGDTAPVDVKAVRKPDGSTVSPSDPQKVRYCTDQNLRDSTVSYMWADETHLSRAGHSLIGAAGAIRASDQF